MKKLNGNFDKFNLAVFISGRGSNLKSILDHSFKKNSLYQVKLVVSNKKNAKGLLAIRNKNIKKLVVDFTKSKSLGNKVLVKLKEEKIKLICLAGFMKILPNYFIKSYKGKIINIHPSLLPKYKGLNTHKRVALNNEKFTGCTVHYVNKKLDAGKIILQKKIKVKKNESVRSIQKRVLKLEHKIYYKAIKKVLSGF